MKKIITTIYIALLLVSVVAGTLFVLETDTETVSAQETVQQSDAQESTVEESTVEDPSVAVETVAPVQQPVAPTPQIAVETRAGDNPLAHAVARAVHRKVNAVRYAHGVSAVSDHDAITSVTLRHSVDMQNNAYFAHINLQGQKPLARFGGMVKLTNVTGCRSLYSENLAMLTTGDYYVALVDGVWQLDAGLVADKIVQMWMESTQGHRENMLMDSHRLSGIGVSVRAEPQSGYKIYVTQNFCS